ncbi:leucine-rich repeat neuronal protein 2 [Leucoraja erinacea]|uniref:leucine-rich repeat neuronal protein 2 n=1 Tax=Leucoraja erinaceus TaxID=7782 RepID=UPI002454E86F|nr:leucine-rich repeat neuronal protein 2 [Leucoraja erinacea]XP_055510871.1 leucine-rich repeat neuronal protein 2 [Leucoraja erinacea]XP_055510872.1 leucine-rich repeat neuronal protein 2 [Leucoraja erinacea]
MLLTEYILISLATVTLTHAIPWHVQCPDMCVCEVKPWFTPRSVYRKAPTVDCNDFLMSKVPGGLPEGTQTLLLQSNRIAKMEAGELQHLVNLTELDLSQNSFSQMEDVSLTNMSNLLVLHLEENQLMELSERCFSALTNLQELYLNHNQLSAIPDGAFFGLDNLLRLHLNSNKLRAIDRRWFEALPSLEILMIGENAVDQLNTMNFKPLVNLRSLVLSGMRLREISDYALEGLENLESISFYDNSLSKVPKVALQKVPGLKFLDLNKNSIERIQQSDFTDMLHLKELGISHMGELVSIDKFALDNLPELTRLEVTNNPKFSYIHPDAFRLIPQMETLMLNNNALSALYKKTVESLSKLQEISIHSNPIRCDCVIRWVNSNENRIRFIEPQSTLCVEPPELKRTNLREVPFREMTDRCLPLISPEAFPEHLSVETEESLSLHCRAFAEPDPEIYWVTPSGNKLGGHAASGRYRVHPEGTLEIVNASSDVAGLYTCVAHNLVGADSKNVAIEVSGFYPENQDSAEQQLSLQEVDSHHVLVSWLVAPNVISSNITWSRTLDNNNSSSDMDLSARVPAGVHAYNLTRLQAMAEYVICVRVSRVGGLRAETSCVKCTTREDSRRAAVAGGVRPSLLIALITLCALFATASVLWALRGLKEEMEVKKKGARGRTSVSAAMQRSVSVSLSRVHHPLVKRWEAESSGQGETIAVDLPSTPLGPLQLTSCCDNN